MAETAELEEKEEMHSEEENDEPDGEVTRGHALTDARAILNQERNADTELSTKAWRSVQFSGLTVTIFAALVTPHVAVEQFDLLPTLVLILSALLFGISILVGVREQDSIKVQSGPETKYYRLIAENEYRADDYVKKSLKIHADSIDNMNEGIKKKSRRVKISLFTSIAGFVFLLLGVIAIFV